MVYTIGVLPFTHLQCVCLPVSRCVCLFVSASVSVSLHSCKPVANCNVFFCFSKEATIKKTK